jgi:hypothetical protein
MENLDYPELKKPSLDAYFQEELVTLSFFSVRSCAENLVLLYKRLGEVLELLESNMPECSSYVDLFYKLVVDIRNKGEHDLTYMMILEWDFYFPELAKRLLSECLNWRDIVYFCHYIMNNYALGRKVRSEAMVEYCVRRMNKQFISDMEMWKYSVNAGSLNHISNVAKWIPRENKRFSWLYELLVLDWINHTCPYLLSTTSRSHSYSAAILKGKRLYRKKVATLNKALKTVQIKQCAGQIDDIQPNSVSKYTAMKQPKLVQLVCNNKNYESSREPDQWKHNYYHHVPIAYFVKSVVESNDVSASASASTISDINKQWYLFTKQVSATDARTWANSPIVPVLDISNSIQYESLETYYSAVGIAIFIAQQSSSMRVLAIGDNPIWIQFTKDMTFIDCVRLLQERCHGYQGCRVQVLIDLIVKGLSETSHRLSETDSSTVPTLCILSDFSTSMFSHFHEKVSCKIIYWNLSSKLPMENLVLPFSLHHQADVQFVSGFSITSSYSCSNRTI